jgi:hypothetical protein
MNHTSTLIAGILAVAAALIGAVAIGIQQNAAAQTDEERDTSITNFIFKQKLKNNCSGNATCANTASEALAGV